MTSAAAQTGPVDPDPSPTRLDDVVVVGTRLDEAAATFVREVSAPIAARGAATWREPVCVGVGNLASEAARPLADRVSDWAASLGLRIAEPGCEPNLLIVFAADGDAVAQRLVAARPRQFATGVAGADRGTAALNRFQTSGRLVRWWHVSLPTEPGTGAPIRRMPGQPPVEWSARRLVRPSDFGVNQNRVAPSRLTQDLRDDLQRVVIVVDVRALEVADALQLADYVALVGLVQINPDIDPSNLDSILRVLDDPASAPDGLTAWDRSYLASVYSAEQTSTNPAANRSEIARLMAIDMAQARTETPAP